MEEKETNIDKNMYVYLVDDSQKLIKIKLNDIYENNLKKNIQKGSPLINFDNNLIIGIYNGKDELNNNKISLLKEPINSYNNKEKDCYEINLKLSSLNVIDKEYFLSRETNILSDEINESNIEIYIDGKKHKFQNYFENILTKEFLIRIIYKSRITNFKNLFYGCSSITDINFSKANTTNITNMSGMFSGCSELKNLDLKNFDTSNVTDMSNMFSGCSNLRNLNLSNFNFKNVKNMSNMFNCCSFISIYLLELNNDNLNNISGIFKNCHSLRNIWFDLKNFENVTDMSYMFSNCWNLEIIKGIKFGH